MIGLGRTTWPTERDRKWAIFAGAKRVWLAYRTILERNQRLTKSLPFNVFTQTDTAAQRGLAEFRLTAIVVWVGPGQ